MKYRRIVSLVPLLLLLDCGGDSRDYVIDCREAGMKAISARVEDDWNTKEIHFNRKERQCYLSLESSSVTIAEGKRLYSETEVVRNVDENSTVLGCSSVREQGAPEAWLCSGRNRENITRNQFLEQRKALLEK